MIDQQYGRGEVAYLKVNRGKSLRVTKSKGAERCPIAQNKLHDLTLIQVSNIKAYQNIFTIIFIPVHE